MSEIYSGEITPDGNQRIRLLRPQSVDVNSDEEVFCLMYFNQCFG